VLGYTTASMSTLRIAFESLLGIEAQVRELKKVGD
jgi:hypothetical protein